MDVQINYLAVFLAALSSFAVGIIWYSRPAFGTIWMKMVGMTDKKAQSGMAMAMGRSLVASLLTAYVVAHVTYLSFSFYGNSILSSAISTAFWLAIGISLTTIVTHDAFEQRDDKLTLINLGNQLVTLLAMGAIIGLFGV